VTVRYGQRLAVDDVAVTLHPGEVVALVGPNGAGKSSLLLALATGEHARDVRLVPDDADALFVRDTVAAECRRADRRAHLPVGTTIARVAALLGRGDEDGG
jgi:energy-coupling factor transport system ATP-binding protein